MPNGLSFQPPTQVNTGQAFSPFQASPRPSQGLFERIKEFFVGQPEEFGTIQRFEPQQQQLLDQLLQLVSGSLQPGGQAIELGPIEELARSQFQEKTIPSILERFGAESGGSSALSAALQQGGRGLETQLAALRQGQLQNLLQPALTQRFEPLFRQSSPGFLQQAGQIGGQFAGQAGKAALLGLL